MKHRKYKLLIIAVLLVDVVLLISALWDKHIYPRILPGHSQASRLPCGANLRILSNALAVYAANHQGNQPPADKWCDVLMAEPGITHNHFICPGSKAKKGQSSYSLNKHIIARNLDELPPNTVILFESKPAWNQIGGPELLALKNHRGTGCNIVFRDGSAKFCATSNLAGLNWNIPPEPNE